MKVNIKLIREIKCTLNNSWRDFSCLYWTTVTKCSYRKQSYLYFKAMFSYDKHLTIINCLGILNVTSYY